MCHTCWKCLYLDVAHVCNGFQVFLQVFETHVSSVLFVFFCMFEVSHLNVSKVDRCFAHWMRVGSGRGCKRVPARSGDAGPLLGRRLASPMLLRRSLNRYAGAV